MDKENHSSQHKQSISTLSPKPSSVNTIIVDAIIVGAGPVGIVNALLLSKQGLKCALIEKNHKQNTASDKNSSFDGRTLALNLESVALLKSLQCLPPSEKKPIHRDNSGQSTRTLRQLFIRK